MNLDWICLDSKIMYGAQEAVKAVLTVSMVMNLLELMDGSATFVWMVSAAGTEGGLPLGPRCFQRLPSPSL